MRTVQCIHQEYKTAIKNKDASDKSLKQDSKDRMVGCLPAVKIESLEALDSSGGWDTKVSYSKTNILMLNIQRNLLNNIRILLQKIRAAR